MCELERMGTELHMVVCKLDNIHQDLERITQAISELRKQ